MNKQMKLLTLLSLIGIYSIIFATSVSAQDFEVGRNKNNKNKEAIQQALENNDYQAFKTLLDVNPKPKDAPEITEAIFAKLAEANRLRKSGDMEGAQKIMNELGFKKLDKDGHKMKGDFKIKKLF